jgi:hypothetical protein
MLHLFVLGGAAFAIGREFRDRTAGAWIDVAHGNIVAALLGKLLPMLGCFILLGLGTIAWLAGYRGWAVNGSIVVWGAGLTSLILACCAIPALLVGLTGTLRMALGIAAFANVTASRSPASPFRSTHVDGGEGLERGRAVPLLLRDTAQRWNIERPSPCRRCPSGSGASTRRTAGDRPATARQTLP